jgi:phosphohistidine phosphatase
MFLYLVQHAQAKTKQEDPERSLNREGLDAAGKMASYAGRHLNISVDTIVHSGKKRAQQTAEILAAEIKPAGGVLARADLDPDSDPAAWVDILTHQDDDIMIVGHLPHLSKLTTMLLCGFEGKDKIHFRNCGIVCLEKDESAFWSLNWMMVPSVICDCREEKDYCGKHH